MRQEHASPLFAALKQMGDLTRVEWRRAVRAWRQRSWQLVFSAILLVAILWSVWQLNLGAGAPLFRVPLDRLYSAIPTIFTLLFFALWGWLCFRSPAALWSAPDLPWFLVAPVPLAYILGRAFARLLGGTGNAGLLLLVILLILLHSFALPLPFLLALALALLYEMIVGALCALLLTLLFAFFAGRRSMRRSLFGTAVGICALPALVFLLMNIPALARPLNGALTVAFSSPLSPGALFTTMPFVLMGVTFSTLAVPSGLALLLAMVGWLFFPVLLACLCVLVARRAFAIGWEGLQAAPRSQRGTQEKGALSSPWNLWMLAWKLPGIPVTLAAIIGFCWQDARYDWTRWSTIALSIVVMLLLFPGTIVGFLAAPVVVALALGGISLLVAGIGTQALARLMQARAVLMAAPISAGTLIWGCLLANALPAGLLVLVIVLVSLFLTPTLISQGVLLLACACAGGLLICLVGVATGAFAVESSEGRGTRLSSLLTFLGNTSIYLGMVVTVLRTTIATLDVSTQRMLLDVMTAFTHLPLKSQGDTLFLLLMGIMLSISAGTSIAGWRYLRNKLNEEGPFLPADS